MRHYEFGSGFFEHGNWMHGAWEFFPGPMGWLIMLLFGALVIYLIVKLFQTVFTHGTGISPSPLEILKQRYARGEIDDAEFRRIKSELR